MAAVVLVGVAALVGLAGCSDAEGSGDEGDVGAFSDMVPAPLADELTESGRCADGRLWAADDAGSLAVVVDAAPEPGLDDVTVLRGEDPCSGEDGSPAVAGSVVVEDCLVAINGLESEDGTTFGPIEIEAPCG